MGKKSCKKGFYYCNNDKKCKPIPDGYKMREDGFLVKEGWSDKYKKSIDFLYFDDHPSFTRIPSSRTLYPFGIGLYILSVLQ